MMIQLLNLDMIQKKKDLFRWTPYRVRYDKTQSYKEGNPVFGNYEKTANSIFFSLEYPVTEDMILTGKISEQVLLDYKNSKNKHNNNTKNNNNYYANQNYDPQSRKSYQLFHNLYIKENILKMLVLLLLKVRMEDMVDFWTLVQEKVVI